MIVTNTNNFHININYAIKNNTIAKLSLKKLILKYFIFVIIIN